MAELMNLAQVLQEFLPHSRIYLFIFSFMIRVKKSLDMRFINFFLIFWGLKMVLFHLKSIMILIHGSQNL